MRKIKFRGKRINGGEWVYGSLLQDTGLGKAREDTLICAESTAFSVIPETVGQFTSLIDKNGKEIYEGDVVRFIDYTYTPLDGLKHEGYIAYNKGYFEIVVGDNLRYCLHSLQLWVYNHCEVIGNIHDNPDLLTDGRD